MRAVAPLLAALLTVALAAAVHWAGTRDTPTQETLGPLCSTRSQRQKGHDGQCAHLVHEYMAQHMADFEATGHDVNKLLFFMHVPRTAGKTYGNCFLRTGIPPSKRCAKSYDTLRLNVSLPDCQTLISHDDFSISQFFPEGTITITQLRRPVERVISSYEFAVDFAAKGVLHVVTPRKSPKRQGDFVGTLEVWPWSILIPWFKRDMTARMEQLRLATLDDPTAWRAYTSPNNRTYYWNEAKNLSVWHLPDPEPVLNPYNNSLVMPLHEFIEHPIAQELLHNGGTLQVLGLTNHSYWPAAKALRQCMHANSIVREMLLILASKRLKTMAHVGLTERLGESVLSLAADLGLNLSGPAYKYTSASAFSYDEGSGDEEDQITFFSATEGKGNVTVPRREAAQRFKKIVEEQRDLKLELEELKPRLNDLVDREARWLEERDALQVAKEAAEFGEQQVDTTNTEAADAATAEAGTTECSEGITDSCSAGQEEEEAGETGQASDGGEVIGGDTKVAVYGTEEQEQQAGDGGADEEQDLEEEFTDIDSPWSEEIVALDEVVAAKQERMQNLKRELLSLQNSGLFVSADEATGQARQLLPDNHYLLPNETLGEAYARCAMAGKGQREQKKIYKNLRTPWGETLQFGPESRALISPEIHSRIHQLNSLDEELWKAGHALLEQKLAEQREAGLLQTFPLWTASRQHYQDQYSSTTGKRRKLHNTEDLAKGGGSKDKPIMHEILYSREPAAATAAEGSIHADFVAGVANDTASSSAAAQPATSSDAVIDASARLQHNEL